MSLIAGGHRAASPAATNAGLRHGPSEPLSPRVADIAGSLSRREWDELTDIVVRHLERNLADELARRGRRAMPRGR